MLADLTPLRESRDYRLLFSGQVASYIGRQFTVVAIPIQVYAITKSSLAVGLVGLASLGPLIIFSLAGGAMSDAFDRRKLLLINQVLLATTSVVLALNASLEHPALWPLFVFGSLSAGFAGADMQTRNAITPRLVRRETFPAAAACMARERGRMSHSTSTADPVADSARSSAAQPAMSPVTDAASRWHSTTSSSTSCTRRTYGSGD